MSSAPTIGRIVHYRSFGTPGGEYSPQCRAAIVTAAPGTDDEPQPVGLAVFNPTGIFLNLGIEHDESRERGGTWHWPCVVTTDSPLGGESAKHQADDRPHSRACGIRPHDHGPMCARDCPTCGGAR